ncbi:MAG: DUF1549 and DUF1553 domain-containing protein [Pirellulaceae bacterium]|nr:DUF1549 and DUF1553 domain-containing protein [Pirellulaceae bacterium]
MSAVWTLSNRVAVADEISFRRDITPILTKLGCNGGSCHGKSTGRGGFQLSLFGFSPQNDYDTISRGSRGRRIFPGAPASSLLLRKATMATPHGGGRRLAETDPEYEVLLNWISASAPGDDSLDVKLTELRVEPSAQQLTPHESTQMRVVARYSDDSERDVTRLARYKESDGSVASVDRWGVVTTHDRVGESVIIIQYQALSALSRVAVPNAALSPKSSTRIDQFTRRNFIDEHVAAKLKSLNIPPSDLSTDSDFLRRATLQIAGRLPSLKEVTQFIDDASPTKRSALIERLLMSGDYADHFAQKWCDVLRIKRRGQKDRIPGTLAFHRWVRNALAGNMPYDQFVREIITATGDVKVNPTAQWYAEVRYLDRYVDDTAQVFLGTRIGCARCHHHPFEKISQDDYFGLAAFFGRVARKGGAGVAERRANEAIYVKATGEVKHPVTGQVVQPRGLGGPPVEIAIYDDPRHALVDWMSESDNPYFARAFVNRMWSHFFGRGLVDPLDDLRVTNPSSNDALLDALANEFVQSGFDMKQVVRLIANSHTYQLSSQPLPENLADTQHHSRFYPQRLTAEVLLDAVDVATGSPSSYGGLPKGTRAVQLPDEGYSNDFLRLFGRPTRESACECERTAEPSLSQSLFVMNSSFIDGKLTGGGGFAAQYVKQSDHRTNLDSLFRRVFSRPPTAEESGNALKYLRSEADAKKAYANLYWALLNTKEFYYIH